MPCKGICRPTFGDLVSVLFIFLGMVCSTSLALADVIVVTSSSDVVNGDASTPAALAKNPGPDGISLREAMMAANNVSVARAHRIEFDTSLKGTIITLAQSLPWLLRGQVTITGDIDGDGAPDITLDGGGFTIAASDITISGFNIVNLHDIGIRIGTGYKGSSPKVIERVTLRGNVIVGGSYAGITVGNLDSNCIIKKVEISRNTLRDGAGRQFAIGIGAATGYMSTNNRIVDLTFTENNIELQPGKIGLFASGGTGEGDTNNAICGLVVSNNTVSGPNSNPFLISGGGAAGSQNNRVDGVLFSGNVVNGGAVALEIVGGGSGSGSTGQSLPSGVSTDSRDNTVTNVRIVGNMLSGGGFQLSAGYGILAQGAQGYRSFEHSITNVTIEWNRISNGSANGIFLIPGSDGGQNDLIQGITIRNNLIANSSGCGISCGGGLNKSSNNYLRDVDAINNTIVRNAVNQSWARGIYLDANNGSSGNIISGVRIVNTILWGNGGGDSIGGANSPESVRFSILNDSRFRSGNGNFYASPQFVDSSGMNNPRLLRTSPAIDAGDSGVAGVEETDLDGNPRVVDGNGDGQARIDIGACEYVGEASVSPDLKLTMIHSGSFAIATEGNYLLTIFNAGSAATTGPISLTDTLPTGLSYISGSGAGWTCAANSQSVTCTRTAALTVHAYSSVTLTVGVSAEAAPGVTNTAVVTTAGDANPDNDQAAESTDVKMVFYFPQVADGLTGSGRFQTTLVFVNTGADTEVQVDFFDDTGQAMPVAVGSDSPSATVSFPLKRGASFSAQTAGTGPLQAGYAKVTSSLGVGGTAVYTYSEGGIAMYEAGVPGTTGLSEAKLFLDCLDASRDTGLAIVNLGTRDAIAKIALYDKSGRWIATKYLTELVLAFGPGYHLARYAREIFPEIEQQSIGEGVLEIASDQPLAAITVRQRDDYTKPFPLDVPTLSTFPVAAGIVDQAPTGIQRILYFPQVADGQTGGARFQTSLIFLSPSEDTKAKVEFFHSDGTPMPLSLGSLGTGAAFDIALRPRQTFVAQTNGVGELQAGYARLTADETVAGIALFTYSETGMILTEAGVPMTSGLTDFTVFMDCGGGSRNSGLALANTGTGDATIVMRLYDKSFDRIATKTLSLTKGDHLARFATEIFPEINAQKIDEGVITVQSDQPLAALTLRQHQDPVLLFPNDVYLLTIFPVFRGRADQ